MRFPVHFWDLMWFRNCDTAVYGIDQIFMYEYENWEVVKIGAKHFFQSFSFISWIGKERLKKKKKLYVSLK